MFRDKGRGHGQISFADNSSQNVASDQGTGSVLDENVSKSKVQIRNRCHVHGRSGRGDQRATTLANEHDVETKLATVNDDYDRNKMVLPRLQ